MKFIYVFNESDRETLLAHGYVLVKEPKKKRAAKKAAKEGAEAEVKEELNYWVFANKTVKDLVFDSFENYVLSDTLTF